ncbi:hypothetical protein [Natrialba asiatica]|uniref:Uncharacterized protein n=1 Tax=Natrialba asiatica (strain ATCC 700177 / DSM 12278 / JCM 9576 / FERM P-10747 / NBRC 102637 / 172P1) TaxID=29540 RepID=M0AZ49_NATA1|nr:hypothetical protein [Natrialba asiatica]ELZ03941.1 hypothetical protein C481_04206 [Natrialba asiatica DSM 12278]
MAGTVVADSGTNDQEEGSQKTAESPVSASMEVDPSTRGLTDGERTAFVNDMSDKYGQEIAERIVPDGHESADGGDIGTQGQMPGLEPGSLVWDDDEHLEVDNPYGQTLVESDNYAALYETNVYKDGGNDRYYIYWLWSAAQSIDHINITGNIKEFWNHIDLTNSADVTVYDPGGDVTKNGIPVTVSASVSGTNSSGSVGASAGIEGEFYLSEDTVGPHPDKTGQDTDEFAVRWDGNYEGSQEINGTLVERRDTWDNRSFTWSVYLDGAGI